MASAWGNSWGSAWGNAWGAIASAAGGWYPPKKKRQIYVEQDGKILLFKTAHEAASWLNAQKVAEVEHPPAKRIEKQVTTPRVIDVAAIEPLAIRFDLMLDFRQHVSCCDMESLWELAQRILRLRDEEDIEILLLAT